VNGNESFSSNLSTGSATYEQATKEKASNEQATRDQESNSQVTELGAEVGIKIEGSVTRSRATRQKSWAREGSSGSKDLHGHETSKLPESDEASTPSGSDKNPQFEKWYDGSSYKCNICGFIAPERRLLRNHLK